MKVSREKGGRPEPETGAALRKGEEVKRRWLIFHCDHDDCWIVSRLDEGSDICLGVAECPDNRTAEAVAEAMRLRDSELRELRELVGDDDPLPDPPEPGSPETTEGWRMAEGGADSSIC